MGSNATLRGLKQTHARRRKASVRGMEPTEFRFRVDYQVPDDLKAELREMIDAHNDLVPTWVHELTVAFEHSDGGSEEFIRATVDGDLAYRRATLTIYSGWLDYSKRADREDAIVHELCHLAIEPMTKMAHALIDQIPRDARKLAREQWRTVMEGATCDLMRQVPRLYR